MISFYITTHNSAHTLKQLLSDFSKQTCRDFEVVIVDAASDDDISFVVSKMQNIIDVRLYRVGYLSIYAGLNRALEVCRGRHCICLGSDDRITDVNYVEKLRAQKLDLETMYYTNLDILRNRSFISKKTFPELSEFQRKYGGLAHLHHQSVIIPRWYLMEQQYDEKYLYYADLDLIFKAQLELPVQQLNISGILFNASGTTSSLSNSLKRIQEVLIIRKKHTLFPFHFRLLASFIRQVVTH